jgi:hypothetical protein
MYGPFTWYGDAIAGLAIFITAEVGRIVISRYAKKGISLCALFFN